MSAGALLHLNLRSTVQKINISIYSMGSLCSHCNNVIRSETGTNTTSELRIVSCIIERKWIVYFIAQGLKSMGCVQHPQVRGAMELRTSSCRDEK